MTSPTGSPNTPTSAGLLAQEQFALDQGEPAEAVHCLYLHGPAGQRHVGAVQAASLDPQVRDEDLPAGQFRGHRRGEVPGPGDRYVRPVAGGPGDAGQGGQRPLVQRRRRPEPHPVLSPDGVHQPRRGVQRRDPPPFEDRDAIA